MTCANAAERQLTALAERDEKKDTYHVIERSFGSFERSFALPDSADQDQIKADFNKGVLRVVIPKAS
jgi:HSP20 family protein